MAEEDIDDVGGRWVKLAKWALDTQDAGRFMASSGKKRLAAIVKPVAAHYAHISVDPVPCKRARDLFDICLGIVGRAVAIRLSQDEELHDLAAVVLIEFAGTIVLAVEKDQHGGVACDLTA